MSTPDRGRRSTVTTVVYILVPVILAGVVAFGFFNDISIQVLLPILLVLTALLILAAVMLPRMVERRGGAERERTD
ncbi:hypothetical protein [Brevibacterium luteolum]|uniref:Uncharacterized protein n=1 Tax=Brevibacterium luteolum TaxID=199591 RepID=A0A6G8KXQ5_9MICO|nr:hypothetical protein [Brevibacterium luteolum]QIN29594.1 hypothetical protein EW640_10125 [Brevibacterium luteolum]